MRCFGSVFVIAAALVGYSVSASAGDGANPTPVGPILGADQSPGFVAINDGAAQPEQMQSAP